MADKIKQEATEDKGLAEPKTSEQSEDTEDTSQPLEADATSEEKSDGDTGKEESLEGTSEDTGEETSEETEESDNEESIEDYLKEGDDKKSGVQKRIDRLTAEKKAAEERIAEFEKKMSDMEEKLTEKEASDIFDEKLPDYTPQQVNEALQKAVDDGDSRLINEIMDYKVKKGQQEAFKRIEKQRQEAIKKQQAHVKEWQTIVEDFSDYAEEDKNFDLSNQQSTLYQLAAKLFNDPSRKKRYHKDGGQRLAVVDALHLIIKKRRGKSSDSKTLEKKLAKERRKSSVSSGKTVKKEDKKPKPSSPKSKLDEYLSSRQKHKQKAGVSF